MATDEVRKLLKRKDLAVTRAREWRPLLEKTYRLSMPNRNGFEHTREGSNKGIELYDLTLALGVKQFVNRLVNALVPSDTNWFQFVVGPAVTSDPNVSEDDIEQLNRALQDVTDIFFQYLRTSNFDLVINEALTDMAVSTGILLANESNDDDNPFNFSSVPPHDVAADEGVNGAFSGFFREFKDLNEEQAFELWPEMQLPAGIKFEGGRENTLSFHEMSVWEPRERVYKYYVIEKKSSEIVYQKVEDSWAWIAFRWSRLSGELWGRGPAIDAMPSSASINAALKDELIAAGLRARPMYMGFHDGVFNPDTLSLEPGSVFTVSPTGGGQFPIAPVPNAGDIQFSAFVVNDLREQINRLLLTNPLGSINAPNKTATEQMLRVQQLREDAGASFARMQRELFDKLIERCVWILKKRGLFPPIEVNGREIAISYITPLSQGKGFEDVQRFLNYVDAIRSVAGDQVALTSLELHKVPNFLAENIGVELDLITSTAELQAMMEEAEAGLEAQQLAAAEQIDQQQEVIQ